MSTTLMTSISIPVLKEETTLEEALERMRNSDSRAIIVEYNNNDFQIFLNKTILEDYRSGKNNCGSLTRPLVDSEAFRMFSRDLGSGIADMVDLNTLQYEPSDSDDSVQAERSSDFINSIRSIINNTSKVCECSGHCGHIEECPPTDEGSNCDYCDGTYVKCY